MTVRGMGGGAIYWCESFSVTGVFINIRMFDVAGTPATSHPEAEAEAYEMSPIIFGSGGEYIYMYL